MEISKAELPTSMKEILKGKQQKEGENVQQVPVAAEPVQEQVQVNTMQKEAEVPVQKYRAYIAQETGSADVIHRDRKDFSALDIQDFPQDTMLVVKEGDNAENTRYYMHANAEIVQKVAKAREGLPALPNDLQPLYLVLVKPEEAKRMIQEGMKTLEA